MDRELWVGDGEGVHFGVLWSWAFQAHRGDPHGCCALGVVASLSVSCWSIL